MMFWRRPDLHEDDDSPVAERAQEGAEGHACHQGEDPAVGGVEELHVDVTRHLHPLS